VVSKEQGCSKGTPLFYKYEIRNPKQAQIFKIQTVQNKKVLNLGIVILDYVENKKCHFCHSCESRNPALRYYSGFPPARE